MLIALLIECAKSYSHKERQNRLCLPKVCWFVRSCVCQLRTIRPISQCGRRRHIARGICSTALPQFATQHNFISNGFNAKNAMFWVAADLSKKWWNDEFRVQWFGFRQFVHLSVLRLNCTEWDSVVYIQHSLCPIICRRQLQFHFSCWLCVVLCVRYTHTHISHFLVTAASSPHLPIHRQYISITLLHVYIWLFVLLPPDRKTVTPSHHNYHHSPRVPLWVNAAANCCTPHTRARATPSIDCKSSNF